MQRINVNLLQNCLVLKGAGPFRRGSGSVYPASAGFMMLLDPTFRWGVGAIMIDFSRLQPAWGKRKRA